MSDAIDKIIDGVLDREKGYVDNPADHGGPTNLGITLPRLTEWLGRRATLADLKALTVPVARLIYQRKYIEQPGFMGVANDTLRELLVDMEVNHRPGKAARYLQKALSVTQDGVIGPKTLAALNASSDVAAIYRKVLADRARLYGRIITDDPSQAEFAAGWGNRLATFVERTP